MTRPSPTPLAKNRVGRLAWLLAALLGALPGCSFTFPFSRQQDFGPALSHNAPLAEIVGRVNDNIARTHSWRSTDVQISGRDLPIKLGAVVAVEHPRNFRLTARSLTSEEADFGSNDEWFWFWMKRSEPRCVFQARHEQMGQTEQLRMIPFQPDWLMEVLGVVPLNEDELSLQPDASSRHEASLISERLSPSGQVVRRVVRVDTQYGLVLQHSLFDERGALIAKANLGNHQRDKETGVVLPHLIQLEWPRARLSMTMEVGRIVVNPDSIPSQTWVLPTKPGYRPYDLGAAPQQYAMPANNPYGPRAAIRQQPDDPRRAEADSFVLPARGETIRGEAPTGEAARNDSTGRVRLRSLSEEPARPADSSDLPDWAREPIVVPPRPQQPPIRRF